MRGTRQISLVFLCVLAVAVLLWKVSDEVRAGDFTIGGSGEKVTVGSDTLSSSGVVTAKDPWVDVRAYGAKGDGTTDDTAAIQAAIDAARYGEVVFPSGMINGGVPCVYVISDTLKVTYPGLCMRGLGGGSFSYPRIEWGGSEDTTGVMIHVAYTAYGFQMQNFKLDGKDSVAVLLHLDQKDATATHHQTISNIQFTDYTAYGLIVGKNSESSQGTGQLSQFEGRSLTFYGNPGGSYTGRKGLLVNATASEFVNFHNIQFAYHDQHIYVYGGYPHITSMVSSGLTAGNYAIYVHTSISIDGWRTEDSKLIDFPAVGSGTNNYLANIFMAHGDGDSTAISYVAYDVPLTMVGCHMRNDILMSQAGEAAGVFIGVKFLYGELLYNTPYPQGSIVLDPSAEVITFRGDQPTFSMYNSNTQVFKVDSLGVISLYPHSITEGDSVLGKQIFDSADSTLKVWDGTTWQDCYTR